MPHLRSNKNVSRAFTKGTLGKPTVWIIERATFRAFRQLKLGEGSNIGAVIPPKPAHVTWFMDRAAKEL